MEMGPSCLFFSEDPTPGLELQDLRPIPGNVSKVARHRRLSLATESVGDSATVYCPAKEPEAWHGMAWHGMAWHGMALHGMAWQNVRREG